jgi:hypothetical protein
MRQADSMLSVRPFVVISLFSLSGCAASAHGILDSPATELEVLGTPPPIDERARFRQLFCETLNTTDYSTKQCDAYLWRLPDEPNLQPVSTPGSSSLRHHVRVLIVGGAFGDCFPPASIPFEASVKRLKEQGYSIDYIAVSGRSSSEHNAITIAEHLSAMPPDDEHPLVLIGYSKGVVDILESLAEHPDAAARVSAVVSIAGAVAGSPLAARYEDAYRSLFGHVRLRACPPGDGGVVRSLERSARLNWLASHPLSANIRYYSLATFSTASQTARALGHTHRLLSKIDERNDGQLLAADEVIPGSALL